MALRIGLRTQRDVWKFTVLISFISIGCSEAGIAVVYLVGGPAAFHVNNAMLLAAVLPVLVTVPITYYVAGTSLALIKSRAKLRELANTDPLTNLPNRRLFFTAAAELLAETTEPVSLLVIDADHFKEINDSYGHATGDKALIAIADILRSSFRQSDLICRVGGEEFAVVLPGMDILQAEKLATRVVRKVCDSPIVEDGAIIEFSVSCGVADTSSSQSLQTLFKAADDAMYVAKKRGRNCVALVQQAA